MIEINYLSSFLNKEYICSRLLLFIIVLLMLYFCSFNFILFSRCGIIISQLSDEKLRHTAFGSLYCMVPGVWRLS